MPEVNATVDDRMIAVWGRAVWPRFTWKKCHHDFAGLDARFAVGDKLDLDLSTLTTHGNDMTNVQGAATLGVLF